MSRTSLTLLVPGLLGPWPLQLHRDLVSGLSAPNLVAILNRSSPLPKESEVAASSVEELLLSTVFPDCVGSGDWPFAALSYSSDLGTVPKDWVMRCDPVHLRPDLGSAYLSPGAELDLEMEDAIRLVVVLNQHLAEDGLVIEIGAADRWYLTLSHPPEVRTAPPSLIAGRGVGLFLPEETGELIWRRRFNELQMVLHDTDVNEERESRGGLPVNSVWFWGAGKLPASRPREPVYDNVWSDNAVAGGLNVLGWQSGSPLPSNPRAWLELLEPGHHLVLIEDAHRAVLSNDVESWRQSLADIDVQWMAALENQRGSLRVELRTELVATSRGMTLKRRRPLSRWRRGRSLQEMLTPSSEGWRALGNLS